jgi:hypothetical protein
VVDQDHKALRTPYGVGEGGRQLDHLVEPTGHTAIMPDPDAFMTPGRTSVPRNKRDERGET